MRGFKLVLVGLFLFASSGNAATVDTISTFSASMKKQIKAVVVKPSNYDKLSEVPVVYLLHGYSDNYAGWVEKVKDFKADADLYNLLIVCPDGGFSSWYFDAPMDSSIRYETYITGELIPFVDKNYKTIRNRKGRAITGLSMGGHGALYLAFKHQVIFGGAGSMSGGVDFRPFPENWDIAKRLGTYAAHPENWEKNTVINMVHLLTPKSLALMIECGVSDFFYTVNENLHAKLLERNIPHDYITRPGGHDWNYWGNSIHYQLLFFSRFFRQPGVQQN